VQQIAWADTGTGECGERRLTHCAEAEQFYHDLKQKGFGVRVGLEATGHSRWFERLLAELNFEAWIGDPAQIRAKRVRKQKNDRRDAEHLLKLMLKNHFPRLWVPTAQNRDVRHLLLHTAPRVNLRLLLAVFGRGAWLCERGWLLKNSFLRNPQKSLRVRMRYKRFSLVGYTFQVTNFDRTFIGNRLFQQPRGFLTSNR
jgi:hypothetical protein